MYIDRPITNTISGIWNRGSIAPKTNPVNNIAETPREEPLILIVPMRYPTDATVNSSRTVLDASMSDKAV